MKYRMIWLSCLAVMLICVSNLRLAAQSYCFTYTSNYADYESEGLSGISSDGTTATLHTSVLVDGYGSMTFVGGNGCGSINYGNIYHIPIAVNVIVKPDGTSVGGQINGSAGCPTCYISEQNDQSVANVNPGDEYTFNYATRVGCTLGGVAYSSDDHWTLAWSINTYARASTNPDGTAEYNLSCPNGNSNAKCALQTGDRYHGSQSFKWAEMYILRGVKHGITYCSGGAPVVYFDGYPAPFPCR